MAESIAQRSLDDEQWQKPVHYRRNPEGEARFAGLTEANPDLRIVDPIEAIIDDMAELRHGKVASGSREADETRTKLKDLGLSYGEWVHLPWRRTVVRYPEADDHRDLRTFRNRQLVTEHEQDVLNAPTVAFFGLSVGSNILDQLAQSGIGSEYLMADHDRLSPTNLNRIRATMADVGLRKTVIAGRKISEVDPFIEQVHLSEGYTDSTDELLAQIQPDIIIEEVDNLSVKAQIRRIAKKLDTPVVMVGDIGERSVLDVERHDLHDVEPFNGKLSSKEYDKLLVGEVSEAEQRKMLVKLNGIRNISPRLILSASDSELGGFPQLGATASAGAALANSAIRGILLGRGMESGTYVANPEKTLKLNPAETKREALRIYLDFLQSQKNSK